MAKKTTLKTQQTDVPVEDFIATLDDEQQRSDSTRLVEIFRKITRSEPKMWGPAIIGFGSRVLKYESGREFDWMEAAFSPRKGTLTLYVLNGFPEQDELLKTLGPHKTGKVCLYIKRLADVDEKVLTKMIRYSLRHDRQRDTAAG